MENLIELRNFLLSTRDSGYKSTAYALAELIDNAIEAKASTVEIFFDKVENQNSVGFEIAIKDDGIGMNESAMTEALKFGGSSRFDSRSGLGRFGMGLPTSSLSQCRRVEVYSKSAQDKLYYAYLDIDEIINNRLDGINKPQPPKIIPNIVNFGSGTLVLWKKCDRIEYKYLKSLIHQLKFTIGRVFRYALWNGIKIKINNIGIEPFDPLFFRVGVNDVSATLFGNELRIPIKIPRSEIGISVVSIKFTELPVSEWASLPNDQKRKFRITKHAGVSILRAGREIDYGWYFMGQKRKENYDDWWRCEISFNPELDEEFGVTHTKQGIKESDFMIELLTPHLENVAHTLNARVRNKFIELKKTNPPLHAKAKLENADVYLSNISSKIWDRSTIMNQMGIALGFQYELKIETFDNGDIYQIEEKDDKLILNINKNHIFYDLIIKSLYSSKKENTSYYIRSIELILFALARSEFAFKEENEISIIRRLHTELSDNLKSYLN